MQAINESATYIWNNNLTEQNLMASNLKCQYNIMKMQDESFFNKIYQMQTSMRKLKERMHIAEEYYQDLKKRKNKT